MVMKRAHETTANNFFKIITILLSSLLAGKRDIVVTILVWCMCVRPCICASVRICPDHNLYNNAWISNQYGTVVALEEEKCLLKHFIGRLKVKVTGVK